MFQHSIGRIFTLYELVMVARYRRAQLMINVNDS